MARVDRDDRRLAGLTEEQDVLLVAEHVLEQTRARLQLGQGEVVAQQVAEVLDPAGDHHVAAPQHRLFHRAVQVEADRADHQRRHRGEQQRRVEGQGAAGGHGRSSQT